MGDVIRFSKGQRTIRARQRSRPTKPEKTIIILPVVRIERNAEPLPRLEPRRPKTAKKRRRSSRRD